MRLQACTALLLSVCSCATSAPGLQAPVGWNPRSANLQRAAALPWMDGGRCVVQEASRPWPVLAERCYPALDHDRVAFHDLTGRCSVASAGAAAMGLGLCVLAAPEIVMGAVIITGVVVVGFAIQEALDTHAEKRAGPQSGPVFETTPIPQESSSKKGPKSEPNGPEIPPMGPGEVVERDRRPECKPVPVKHLGGNAPHNTCADLMPNNSFPGWDVFVNGKNFDALQMATRTLWDVKTDDFDKHSPRSRRFLAQVKYPEIRRERMLAEACGYEFAMGVRSQAHKDALLELDPDLNVVVMDWC